MNIEPLFFNIIFRIQNDCMCIIIKYMSWCKFYIIINEMPNYVGSKTLKLKAFCDVINSKNVEEYYCENLSKPYQNLCV